MTRDDLLMSLAVSAMPLVLYLCAVSVAPFRPPIRKDERVLRWASDQLWWLIATSGLMWGAAYLLYQSDWVVAGVTMFALSLPLLVAHVTVGTVSNLRELTKRSRSRRRS